jgi:hypothetical protein
MKCLNTLASKTILQVICYIVKKLDALFLLLKHHKKHYNCLSTGYFIIVEFKQIYFIKNGKMVIVINNNR